MSFENDPLEPMSERLGGIRADRVLQGTLYVN